MRQAPYIADNFGNMASCPDGEHLPALSAAPGWACGGVLLFGGINFPLGWGLWVLRLAWLGSGGSLQVLPHVVWLFSVQPHSGVEKH